MPTHVRGERFFYKSLLETVTNASSSDLILHAQEKEKTQIKSVGFLHPG